MAKKPDIAVILTVHDDARYLRRTLTSLEQAASFASVNGLTTELIIIGDRPTADTLSWVRRYRSTGFRSARYCLTDFGDPGLARDHGVAIAGSEFVTFADGDDLISYNMFLVMYERLRRSRAKTVCFPHYVYLFGDEHRVVALHELADVNPLSFFHYHPFNSRLMGRTTELNKIRHGSTGASNNFYFEDWHYNCELLASGFDFQIAEMTVLFYRKSNARRNAFALKSPVLITRPSSYFSGPTFLRVCLPGVRLVPDEKRVVPNRNHLLRQFNSSAIFGELVVSANQIDPNVNASRKFDVCGDNVPRKLDASVCYLNICSKLGNLIFDQVVLVPFIVNTGAEKYIFSVLDEIKSFRRDSNILFLSLQEWDKHDWLDRLPQGSQFIDINAISADLTDNERLNIVFRTIQSFAPRSVVHIKACHPAQEFVKYYWRALSDCRFVFYRFCETLAKTSRGWIARADKFDFLSEHGESLDLIVYDNVTQAKLDALSLDFLANRIGCIYIRSSLPENIASIARPFSYRLLWASRLDPQKRPDILIKICHRLAEVAPTVHVDIWGFTIRPRDRVDLSSLTNATYRGSYDGFVSLPRESYDAIVYTSAFDGMPNILLECMAEGISVIAPAVGGIAEAIGQQTGYLIDNSPDDNELIDNYAAAINSFYADHSRAVVRRGGAREYIRRVHGSGQFRNQVRKLFGPLFDHIDNKQFTEKKAMQRSKVKRASSSGVPIDATRDVDQVEIARLRTKVMDLAKQLDDADTPSLLQIRDYYEPKLRKRTNQLHVPIPKFLGDYYEKRKSKKQDKP